MFSWIKNLITSKIYNKKLNELETQVNGQISNVFDKLRNPKIQSLISDLYSQNKTEIKAIEFYSSELIDNTKNILSNKKNRAALLSLFEEFKTTDTKYTNVFVNILYSKLSKFDEKEQRRVVTSK